MKKAKIMLMAILVMGVVGGTLAVKAHNFTRRSLYGCTTTTKVLGGTTYYACIKTITIIYSVTTTGVTFVTAYSTSPQPSAQWVTAAPFTKVCPTNPTSVCKLTVRTTL